MYNSAMFLGTHEGSITSKNQIYFPSKFRKDAGNKLFITNWFEYSLIILPSVEGERIMSLLTMDLVTLLPEGRRLQRYLYGGAENVSVTAEGKLTLPERLKTYALIQKDVVFRGVGDRIELWSKESFERYGYLTDKEARQTAIDLYFNVKKNGE